MRYWFECPEHGAFSKTMPSKHWYTPVCPICGGPVVETTMPEGADDDAEDEGTTYCFRSSDPRG